MSKEEVLTNIKKNPIFFLGTEENNKPHVRAMSLVEANEKHIVFGTDKYKDVKREIAKNPMVEMCFFIPKEGLQIRISGKAEIIDNLKIKEKIIKGRSFLKSMVEKEGYESLYVYSLKNAKALIWTMEKSYSPKEFIDL